MHRYDLTHLSFRQLSVPRSAAVAIALMALSGAARAESDANGFVHTTPDQVKWQTSESTPQAVVDGDPSKPGIYVVRVRFPPHTFSMPHTHSTDRHVVVLKGTWYMGVGDKFDPATAIAMPPGSYARHPAGGVHWDGAKDEEVEVQIIGEGPVKTELVNKNGPMFGAEK